MLKSSPTKITILNNDVYLDWWCWNCIDHNPFTNTVKIKDEFVDWCPECENQRIIPTETGLQILGFIRKYIK